MLIYILFHLRVLIFPQFVAISFWGIYAFDRELVYPVRLDEHIPPILNHFWVNYLEFFLLQYGN